MPRQQFLVSLFTAAIALCVVGLSPQRAESARVDEVTKGSYYAHLFKVVAKKEAAGIRVTVTVPNSAHDNYPLESVDFYLDGKTQVRTNGTSLELLIDEASFEKGFVNANYIAPNHKEGETGGYYGFQLDISSLADGVK